MGLDIKTGETRISAYTGEGMFGGYNTATTSLAGSYYLRRTYEGLDIYALDTDAVKDGALRIFGEFGGETHRTFRTNYPDIPVEVADEYTSNLEALTNAMVSETDVYDVLLLDCTYMPVNRLMDKGYCLDLSGYPQLMEIAGQMNPKYLERMQRDGKLYGMPVQLSANDMAVNIRLWEDELGLSRDDLPKTFMELLEFIQNWEDDYADDFPDIMPLEQVTGKDYLYSMLLDRYMSYQQVQEGGLKFDTPLFKKLMAMADGISGEALSGGLEEGSMEYWNQPYLFTFYYPLSQFDYMRYQQDMEPLLLPMDEGLERLTPANMSVLIINPKSARIDQALLYVENYLKNLPAAGAAITLFPENNAPVVNPNYEKTMAEYQADIAKQEELLEKAEESEKANIRDSIKHMEQFRDEYQQSDQYDVGPEQIAFYREMVEPYVFVAQQSIYTGGNTSELGNVLQQFFQGAMSSDQFAKEMDNRLQMMRLEDE